MTAVPADRPETASIATVRLVAVVLLSVVAITLAGGSLGSSVGARSLLHPRVLTACLWTVLAVAAAWPGRVGSWERAAVVAVGLPAAVVLARVAVVPTGAWLAAAGLLVTAIPAGRFATRAGARGGAALAAAWIGVPALGHGLIELGVPQGLAFLVGSPLVAPAVLAQSSSELTWVSTLPAQCLNLALAAACARATVRPEQVPA